MAVDTEEEDMVAEAVGEVMGVIVVAEVVDGVEGTVAVGAEEVVEEDMGVIHRIEEVEVAEDTKEGIVAAEVVAAVEGEVAGEEAAEMGIGFAPIQAAGI